MHTCQLVLCQSLTLVKLQQHSHSILHPPSFLSCSLSPTLSLPPSHTHPLYLTCWLRYFQEHRLAAELRPDSSFGAPKWLLSLDARVCTAALSPGRCSAFSRHSPVMDQGPVGDGRGIWVSGGFSWLMCLWTWRNGLHHQHSCVWWAANRLRKEL